MPRDTVTTDREKAIAALAMVTCARRYGLRRGRLSQLSLADVIDEELLGESPRGDGACVNGSDELYDLCKAPKRNPGWSMLRYKAPPVDDGESSSDETQLNARILGGNSNLTVIR